jgi:hypothetical protein
MKRFLPLIMFTVLVVAFRVVGSLFPESFPNFHPLGALFFCGALMAKDWRAWAAPLAAWLVTYPIPAFIAGNQAFMNPETLIVTALAFAATFFLGKSMTDKGIATTIAGSVVAALVFHLITNGVAWITSPLYPKNLNGLVQSLWTGPVGSPIPSWVFLRNMAASNLIFTAVFLSARFTLPRFSTAFRSSEAR